MSKSHAKIPKQLYNLPDLSDEEKRYVVKEAKQATKSAISVANMKNPKFDWNYQGKRNGVDTYKGRSDYEDIDYYRGTAQIAGTLFEMAQTFDSSTASRLQHFMKYYSTDFAEGKLLHVLVPPTRDNPYHQVTLKWYSMHSPSSIFNDRDFVVAEYQDQFTDSKGRAGWVRCLRSVDLKSVPPFDPKYGFVRGFIYQVAFIFVESERPGYLDSVVIIKADVASKHSNILGMRDNFMEHRMADLTHFSDILVQRRLTESKLLEGKEMIPKANRYKCRICSHKFGMFLRKHNCRSCGEVICARCSKQWEIVEPSVKRVTICVKCFYKSSVQASKNSSRSDSFSSKSSGSFSSCNYSRDESRDDNHANWEFSSSEGHDEASTSSGDIYSTGDQKLRDTLSSLDTALGVQKERNSLDIRSGLDDDDSLSEGSQSTKSREPVGFAATNKKIDEMKKRMDNSTTPDGKKHIYEELLNLYEELNVYDTHK